MVGLIGASVDISERKREQERARVEAEMLDLLNRTGARLAAELDLDKLIQSVTDAATQLTGARFGAFFTNTVDDPAAACVLQAVCGAPREAFDHHGDGFPTPLFKPSASRRPAGADRRRAAGSA